MGGGGHKCTAGSRTRDGVSIRHGGVLRSEWWWWWWKGLSWSWLVTGGCIVYS
jgi:hypothetical protein